MKLSTIAKTSLALGILTTGVMTTYAQSIDAKVKNDVQNNNQSQNVKDLLTYYSQKGHDLRNVSGYRDGDKVNVIDGNNHTEVDLLGTDKSRINDDFLKSKFDVFVVGEGTSKQATIRSIGGITKTNNKEFKDQVARPQLNITKQNGDLKITNHDGPFNIFKEQISLKELDFKLRKLLIEKHGLYSKGTNKGEIIIKMKGDSVKNRYTFELHKKLQKDRMGDVIVDTTQIDRIDVEYK
ncbi:TPA: superantigen-like protein [Staphylococcus aureus]